MSRDPYLVAVIFSYTDDGQIEGGSQNMSIELLFKIADTLETDPNTILGVKNNVASVDEALNELPLETKSKLSVLFGAMINQIKEQDVINQTNRRYELFFFSRDQKFISYLNIVSSHNFLGEPSGMQNLKSRKTQLRNRRIYTII